MERDLRHSLKLRITHFCSLNRGPSFLLRRASVVFQSWTRTELTEGNAQKSPRTTPAKIPSNRGHETQTGISCDQARLPLERLVHSPSHITLDLWSVLSMGCGGVKMAWRLWEYPTNDCSSLRPMPQVWTHPRHYLVHQIQRLDEPRDLG